MTRPIDADALMEELKVFCDWCRDGRKQGADFVLDCVIPNEKTLDIHTEWIPVSEQMPEEFKTVLVFALSDDGDHGFMTTASHEGRGIWYDECFYQPLPKVYAWMPLPEPYLVKF